MKFLTLDFKLFRPNLTHLTIHDADMYDMKDFLDMNHLPKLTNLSIRGGRISQLFKTCDRRHAGIKSLDILFLDLESVWSLGLPPTRRKSSQGCLPFSGMKLCCLIVESPQFRSETMN